MHPDAWPMPWHVYPKIKSTMNCILRNTPVPVGVLAQLSEEEVVDPGGAVHILGVAVLGVQPCVSKKGCLKVGQVLGQPGNSSRLVLGVAARQRGRGRRGDGWVQWPLNGLSSDTLCRKQHGGRVTKLQAPSSLPTCLCQPAHHPTNST